MNYKLLKIDEAPENPAKKLSSNLMQKALINLQATPITLKD